MASLLPNPMVLLFYWNVQDFIFFLEILALFLTHVYSRRCALWVYIL